MNRRRHPRLDIDIPAVIEYGGNAYADCRLLNFSRGGAYLQCSDEGLKAYLPDGYFAEYERQEALLSVPSESLQVKVKVVYFRNHGLGLAFCNAAGAHLFETLFSQLQARSDGSQRKSEGQTIEPARTRKLLQQLKQPTKRFLEINLGAFFSKAQLDLQHQIETTSDPQEESALFFALNSLEQDRVSLTQRFLERTARGFDDLLGEPRETQETDEPVELALVEKQEIDTWILVNDTARQAESSVARRLYQLEVALSYLCQDNIHNELNPLSPISLLTTLKSVLDDYELDVEILSVLLSSFSNSVLNDLDYLYTELVQMLRKQGIDYLAQQLHDDWTIVPSAQQSDHTGSSIGHLAALANLHASQDEQAAQQGMPIAGQEAVLDTLESLSHQHGASLQHQIEKLLQQETAEPVRLSPEARSAIGAGEELVAELSKDPLITNELRALLASLKFLIIEAVLQDNRLLDYPEHPVRKLLDTIESLKPYVNTGSHASLMRDREADRLAAITDAVASGSIKHVDQVTHEVQSLMREQRERFEKNRKLAISRCLKDEKLRRAQIQTYEALSNLLLNRSVSIAVDKLLRFGWFNLLVQCATLNGAHSQDWKNYLQVVELLVNLFEKESSADALTKDQRQDLLSTIRKGLNAYPVHPQGAKEFVDSLTNSLIDGDREESDFAWQHLKVDAAYLQPFFRHMHLRQEQTALQTPDSEWLKRVDNIALDTWLIEQTEKGGLRVLSLAWKNPDNHRYLLVDGNGFKALDEDQRQLASRFAASRITPMELPGQPIVERTIESILSNSYEGFKQESSIDQLTGLSNRRTFEAELRERLRRQSVGEVPHAMLLFDLDRFQAVNDLCGFEGGDRLLQTVADILLSNLTDEAFVARTGDDEFCLLLQGYDLEQGYQTAETLRLAIDEFAFEWAGRMIPSSVSVGIVQSESSGQTSDQLMQAALAACNMAKEGGGNCTRIYLASDSVYQEQQQLVESLPAIKEALTKGRMELFVQPIVPLRESETLFLHHEILLRVRNAEGKLETPQEFVLAAERYDMMREVDHWVVESFFDLVEPYADKLPMGHSFAINLSGKSVGDSTFQNFLKERINTTNLQPGRLGFEITETALVGDISDTAAFIQTIRELGCSFSLDDFGSGYASFSYLKDFPVDFVKIDGIFVREILNKPADYAMIKSITEIAHFMDKLVIAEFVSNAEIGQALQTVGVDYGQGYHFSKPRPLKQVLAEIVEEKA